MYQLNTAVCEIVSCSHHFQVSRSKRSPDDRFEAFEPIDARQNVTPDCILDDVTRALFCSPDCRLNQFHHFVDCARQRVLVVDVLDSS